MKSLTHIRIDGIKNLSRVDLDIPPLLALRGENGTGKTATLSSIKMGIIGFDPEIGRRLEATRQLITEGRDSADVALTFSDGFGISRRFGASLDTRVMPPKGERTERDTQRRIDEETGSFVLSFDLQALLSLSKEKRRAWLMSTLPRQAVNLDNDVWRRWLGYRDAEEFIQRAIDHLWQHQVVANQSLLDGLASALEYTREQFNGAERKRQAQVKVSESADQAAAEASAVAEPDPERLSRIQEELAGLERRRGELREQLAGVERAQQAARKREHDIRVREMRVADAGRDLDAARARKDAFDPAAARREAEPEIERLQQKLAEEQAVAEMVAAAAAALERAEQKVRGQREAIQYHAEQIHTLQHDVAQAEGILSTLRDGECPVCGSTAVSEVLEKAEAEIAELQPRLERARSEHEAATEQLVEFERALRTARQDSEVAGGRRHAMQAARQDLRAIEARLAEAEAGAAVRAETLAEDVARRERELETMRQDLAAAKAEPITEPDGAACQAELDEADAAVARLRDEQLELQGRERAAGRGEALREQADKERGVLELRTKKADSLKALRDAQQKLRAHVIEQLVGPVEQTAQQVLREIDEAKTFRFVFEREGRDTFDFGFEEDGVFRSYDAASTGEDAFLSVVLVAALIAACAPPWRVLLVDNVEQIDDLRRRWLMMALGRISDRLDNIILAGCCEFADIEGWTVVNVEELTGARAVVAA